MHPLGQRRALYKRTMLSARAREHTDMLRETVRGWQGTGRGKHLVSARTRLQWRTGGKHTPKDGNRGEAGREKDQRRVGSVDGC